MKNIKYIPALALVALLSACNVNKGLSPKAPKFAKKGEQVEHGAIAEKREAEGFLPLMTVTSTDDVVSAERNKEESYIDKIKVTNKKKTVLSSKSVRVTKENSKGDMNNLIISYTSETKSEETEKSEFDNYSKKTDDKYSYNYQYGTLDDKEYLLYVDPGLKMYDWVSDVTGKDDEYKKGYLAEGVYFEVYGPANPNEILDIIDNWGTATEEEQMNYKFFMNKDVYTIEYYSETSYEEVEPETNVVTYKETTVSESTLQLEIKENGYEWRIKGNVLTKVEFNARTSYEGTYYNAGDVLEIDSTAYIQTSLYAKDVKLEPIDISSYNEMIDVF